MSTPDRDDSWTLTEERLEQRHPGLAANEIRRLLGHLEEVAGHLEELGRLGATGLSASTVHSWAAERGLQIAAEVVLAAGRRMLAPRAGDGDEDPGGLLDALARQRVLANDLRHRLVDLVRWRELPRAADPLDLSLTAGALARAPREIGDFARAVRLWLAMELLPAEDDPGPEEPPGAAFPAPAGSGGNGPGEPR